MRAKRSTSEVSSNSVEANVDSSVLLADSAAITVLDSDFQWSDSDVIRLGAELEIEFGASDLKRSVFKGEITAIEPNLSMDGGALVVLPATLVSKLDHDELLAVLIHEREHLERRDTLRYEAVAIVRTLFWFYPPVWWLSRRILESTEMSCDEAVVRAGLSPATWSRSERLLRKTRMSRFSPRWRRDSRIRSSIS